jgi:2-aminoethylphosphonate-pyruvate transaminase
MDINALPDNPYLLLTPGPLSTTKRVRAALFRDWCTWDDDYNGIVQHIRARLVRLATGRPGYTAVLMQGSGSFGVESVVGSVIPQGGKLLVLANGAYGQRIATMARMLGIDLVVEDFGERAVPDPDRVAAMLEDDPGIGHVAMVHCETTTGMLNPVAEVGTAVAAAGRRFIVDAMSSFGGIPLTMEGLHADFLISSANKCIQGVPGFSFIIARQSELEGCRGRARSHSLDLWDQWNTMEAGHGKWRFTSPTHTVRAFDQALAELDDEGGVEARHRRYRENQAMLVQGMRGLGFQTLLDDHYQSPIITAFHSPESPHYDFGRFYQNLKSRGFVIYPGKVTGADTFRIGNIGDVHRGDIERLLLAVGGAMDWSGKA